MLAALVICETGIALAAQEEFESPPPAPQLSSPPQDVGTELPSKRTTTSDTFLLPDGSRETRIFENSINYRDTEGDWKPIDEGLKELEGGGLSNGPNRFDIHLPEKLGSGPTRLSIDGEWVSAKLAGSQTEEAQLQGETATYESASGDAIFAFESLPNGLKEDIEIADPSAPHSFVFELDTSAGLTPEAAEDGSIRLHDESGRRVAELPPPILLDSTPGEPQVSHDVHYELAPGADHGWLLTVNAETEWLAKPDLTWPIHLDPTMTLPSPELDCAIVATEGSEGSGLCGSKGQKQLYGRYRHVMFSNCTSKEEWARSLLRFNLS